MKVASSATKRCSLAARRWRVPAFARHFGGGWAAAYSPAHQLLTSLKQSTSFHSPCGRASYFLCSCRESKQRDTPQSIAPFGPPAQRVRVSGRVRLTAHPCAGSRISAIPRAAPCGAFPTAATAMQWGPGKAEAARSCAQKPRQRAKALRAAALDPAGDLRVPVCRGEGRSEMPVKVARTMRASSLHAQGRAFNEPRPDPRAPPQAARHPGCVLFGYFLLHKQEKVTRALDARGKVNGYE